MWEILRDAVPVNDMMRARDNEKWLDRIKDEVWKRERTPEGSEPGDDTDGDVGEIGMAAEGLACLRIGQMYLNERQADPEQCIAQRDAGVGEASGIEY